MPEEGLGMSPKRITLSTAGISKMIKKLGDDEVRFNLACPYTQQMMKKGTRLKLMNQII